jgi:endonuclease YncB( thermonuclease family)
MKRRGAQCCALLLTSGLLLAAARGAAAESFVEGRVVAVFDGDTIEVLVERERRRVRIAGIDTPERGQPWAERAKQALAGRVFGKDVRINEIAIDRYGRTIGEVYADNVCVGCELVREGHAWVYRGFTEDAILFELEAEARAAGRGLWGLPESERTPPWEWRRTQRRSAEDAKRHDRKESAGQGPPADFACGAKRFCSEMSSCAEARFHQRHCGLQELDGDADGIPCESLCRPR